MARIWTEGFENKPLGTSSTYQKTYNGMEIKSGSDYNQHKINTTSARISGTCLQVQDYLGGHYTYTLKKINSLSEIYTRFFIMMGKEYTSQNVVGSPIIYALCNETSNKKLVYLTFRNTENMMNDYYNNYVLDIYNSLGELIGTTRTLVFYAWNKIDVYYKIDSNNNITIKVKLNDEIIVDTTYNSTTYYDVGGIRFGLLEKPNDVSLQVYFDDMAANDTTGNINNSWCGNGHCEALVPISNGSINQFTPSTGSNYACVDELPVSTTDYVSTTTDGAIDIYKLTSLSGKRYSATTKINAINIYKNAKYTDSQMDPIDYMKINGTAYEFETSIKTTTSSTYYKNIYEVNPATQTQFTVSDIDNSEFGFKAKVGV